MNADISKQLIGCDIGNGWRITDSFNPRKDSTGGLHSIGFIANNSDEDLAFVKVLDLSEDPNLKSSEQTKEW